MGYGQALVVRYERRQVIQTYACTFPPPLPVSDTRSCTIIPAWTRRKPCTMWDTLGARNLRE